MEVVEGACNPQLNGMSVSEAARYVGKTEDYARRALEDATLLSMLTKSDQRYFPTNEVSDVPRATAEQRPPLFRKFLQRFDPFILFVSLIGRGNSIDHASRKVGVIYNVESSQDNLKATLLGWGEYAGIIEAKRGRIILKIDTSKLSAEYIRELLDAMEHDIKARLYIAMKLAENAYGYMKPDEIDFLVKAIRNHQKSSRDSIDDAGRAFEDFLRRVILDNQKVASDCTGITQLAERLKGENLIEQKQLEVCKGLSSIRIAAAHNKDRSTNEPWVINPDAAIETILLVLTMIRSIYSQVFSKIQMF